MLIPCPYCGPRSHEEFTTLGEAGRTRPKGDNLHTFAEHVYLRNNIAGRHRELWFHAAGCHAWLAVERDTLSHIIHGAWPVNEASSMEEGRQQHPSSEGHADRETIPRTTLP